MTVAKFIVISVMLAVVDSVLRSSGYEESLSDGGCVDVVADPDGSVSALDLPELVAMRVNLETHTFTRRYENELVPELLVPGKHLIISPWLVDDHGTINDGETNMYKICRYTLISTNTFFVITVF